MNRGERQLSECWHISWQYYCYCKISTINPLAANITNVHWRCFVEALCSSNKEWPLTSQKRIKDKRCKTHIKSRALLIITEVTNNYNTCWSKLGPRTDKTPPHFLLSFKKDKIWSYRTNFIGVYSLMYEIP